MFGSFIISWIGIFKIYNPFKIIKTWFISLGIISLLIIYFLPKLLNYLFIGQLKDSFELLLLVLFSGFFIILNYIMILLSKKKERMNLKKIVLYIKNFKFK